MGVRDWTLTYARIFPPTRQTPTELFNRLVTHQAFIAVSFPKRHILTSVVDVTAMVTSSGIRVDSDIEGELLQRGVVDAWDAYVASACEVRSLVYCPGKAQNKSRGAESSANDG